MKIKNDRLPKEGISYGKLIKNGAKVLSDEVIEVTKEIGDRFIKCKGFAEVKTKEVKADG